MGRISILKVGKQSRKTRRKLANAEEREKHLHKVEAAHRSGNIGAIRSSQTYHPTCIIDQSAAPACRVREATLMPMLKCR